MMRVGFSYGLVALIVSEMFASTSGIGGLINKAMSVFDTPTLYANVLLVGALAWVADSLLENRQV